MTITGYYVRKCKYSDLAPIYKLLLQLSDFRPEKNFLNIFREFISQDVVGLVACMDSTGEVIGFGSIFFFRRIRGGIQAYIEDVAIEPEFQHDGVGTRIVKELLFHAKLKGAYRVVLTCSERNLPFYAKFGFCRDGFSLKTLI